MANPRPRPKLPRVQKIALPILRAYPDLEGVTIGSWVADVDHRKFPLINVRRVGGRGRNSKRPNQLALVVVEMTAYGNEDLPATEDLYDVALEALYEAVLRQKVTPYGHLGSIKETMGATEFGSPFQDTWRVQGLIQLGIRPPR
ncbi:hypothetical protein [Mycobacterium intracellulare]|uniref:Tail terminator n=1 Tax=Mycobacterium intracellulare TaxID=1767 RepID=A0AAE4U235_MYCIT|nr:hypothetical protein [Mycobacterium intracellulare]MDV6975337.1 hypothetical protein [Mycobacterium intracellulare]MDV6980401.1 hypothetical protein [Mycobacterium intracellulare]MDV7010830.1 hypothetical protein [Mycobacterium intracellulare]MDV7025736.1 hypothetical protein [Mycobacterium intracellulare]